MRGASLAELRPARLWHLPQLVRILWAFTRATPWLPVVRTYRGDVQTLAYAMRRGWVDFVGNSHKIQGFIARDGERIHALYVHPNARGQGCGAAMIVAAKRRSARLELWTEQKNHAAQEFYRRHGFREMARSDGAANDEQVPDIFYVWHRHGFEAEDTA